MHRWLSVIVGLPLLIYLGFGAFLFSAQSSLLYHPSPTLGSPPPETISLVLHNDAGKLQVWQMHPGREHAVIYFGGNAESVELNIPDYEKAFPHTTVYLMNYRGYGGSDGEPGEQALYADALQLFDAISAGHPGGVSIIGRSLGSGVAAYLASRRPVQRLVLVTPYDSMLAVAENHYPIFPMGLMLKDHYDSLSLVPEIKAPTLILVAEQDRIVPPQHAMRLAAAFPPGQAKLVEFSGTGHNSLHLHAGYLPALQQFLAP